MIIEIMRIVSPVCKLKEFSESVESRVEDEIESEQPEQVIGNSKLEQPLRCFVHIQHGEGHERVDHGGDDVLLDNGHEQVETHNHLQSSSDEEGSSDATGSGKV